MNENTMATNLKPHEHVNFVKSTKIGTVDNKAMPSKALKCEIQNNIFTVTIALITP